MQQCRAAGGFGQLRISQSPCINRSFNRSIAPLLAALPPPLDAPRRARLRLQQGPDPLLGGRVVGDCGRPRFPPADEINPAFPRQCRVGCRLELVVGVLKSAQDRGRWGRGQSA